MISNPVPSLTMVNIVCQNNTGFEIRIVNEQGLYTSENSYKPQLTFIRSSIDLF